MGEIVNFCERSKKVPKTVFLDQLRISRQKLRVALHPLILLEIDFNLTSEILKRVFLEKDLRIGLNSEITDLEVEVAGLVLCPLHLHSEIRRRALEIVEDYFLGFLVLLSSVHEGLLASGAKRAEKLLLDDVAEFEEFAENCFLGRD